MLSCILCEILSLCVTFPNTLSNVRVLFKISTCSFFPIILLIAYLMASLPSQDRLTRCTMHCNDKAKDLFDSGAKEPAVRSLMDRCVGSCVDDHVNLIPSMTRRLKDHLDSIQQ